MVELPTVSGSDVADAFVTTPFDEYELVDFGAGRKLERWGCYLVERPDNQAKGEPAERNWQPDWMYISGISGGGHWQPTRSGLSREWPARIGSQIVQCSLGAQGRVGLQARDLPCGSWVRQRIEGCYDIEELSVLNLFGGNGYVAAQAVAAGASVIHVDADAEMLDVARALAGTGQVTYVRENVMDFVEGLLRREQRFDMIVLPAPALGHGPKGQSWDREVDLPKLIKYLPRLITDACLGIWLSTDSGAITWKAESLGQLLREILPGCTIEPLLLGMKTRTGRVLPAGVAARWYDETEFLQTGSMPLTAAQLEERLDAHMVSLGAAEEPAHALAEYTRAEQDFVLRCVGMVGRTSSGMAFNFVSHVCSAMRVLDEAGVESWLLHCMDIYDTRGLHPAVAAFKDVEQYASAYRDRQTGLTLDTVANVLEAFVHGLNGRRLKIKSGEQSYTDTESLFLPEIICHFSERDANFQLYKTMVVHQWAQTWFGTWRVDVAEVIAHFADADKALACFHALETLRLDAKIKTMFPGVYRQICAFRQTLDADMDACWQQAAIRLQQPGAGAEHSIELMSTVIHADILAAPAYQGVLQPELVESVRKARIEADKNRFRVGLIKMQSDMQKMKPQTESEAEEDEAEDDEAKQPFELKQIDAPDMPDGFTYEIQLDGRPIPPPDDVKGSIASILQDLGEIPEEYLFAAGEGAYFDGDTGGRKSEDVWKGTYHEEGAFIYNEWDYERKNYRKNWSVLRELEVHPVHDHFVDETLHKYRGLSMDLRRTFEALRGEDKLLKRQQNGDDIDIDALVEALADIRDGAEMTDRLFTKMHKLERNIAVMFMVDMSGSTKGWINDAERESLALLSESLEILGDRYAIYGFSGMTRKRCEVYRIKGFNDEYNEDVKARISGIRPKDYTRMGVTIRHLSMLLNEVDARTRLLITLSDGKPDDYDGYRGAYGIEDTRMALLEAKRSGIHPFCITIDTEAKDYLPHMYGAVNYAVIDEVRKLPLKVSDIYRRLTS